MTQQPNREQRRALERATRATRAAGGDPAVAAELDELRRVRTGSYALMQVLVTRMVKEMGDTEEKVIHIARSEWKALPPLEKLKVKVDPATDDVKLWIEYTEPPAG